MLRRICVFCGSSPGARQEYASAAHRLGRLLAERSIELVYGGGKVGLMGILADSVLAHGGHVIGVIPESLVKLEVAHDHLTDLRVVHSMHERKALMADLSDAFIAMPGGLGTLEELLEIATWGQLGLHDKPIGLLNVAGYFDPLLALLDHAVSERFLHAEHRHLLLAAQGEAELLPRLEDYRATQRAMKWLDRDQR